MNGKSISQMRRMMSWSVALLLCVLCALGGAAQAEIVFSDNFNDGTIANPTYSANGTEWTSTVWTYWGYMGGIAYNEERGSDAGLMSINFGAATAPVEVRFKLRQHDLAAGVEFSFGFKDSVSGLFYQENANSNPAYYGYNPATGFISYDTNGGQIGGLGGAHLSNSSDSPDIWDYIKLKFDPVAGMEIWQARTLDNSQAYGDSALTYTLNASWTNFKNMSSVDTFYMLRENPGGRWMLDDVEIDVVPEPGSICALALGLVGLLGIRGRK